MREHDRPAAESAHPRPREGQASPAAVAPTVAHALELQRAVGNRATAALLQRSGACSGAHGCGCPECSGRLTQRPPVLARKEVAEGAEKVELADTEDQAEIKKIIDRLSSDYGIAIDSVGAIAAVRAGYPHAPQAVRDSVKTRRWELFELQAVESAAKSFKPILGKMRASSTRKDIAQEVTKVGKLDQAIDVNKSTGALDTSTVGEYFASDKTLALFTAGERYGGIFGADYKKKRQMTAHHEMSHGLLAYALPGFITASDGYWLDRSTKSGTAGAEAPPTSYGQTNAAEDMCESVALYFVDQARLKDGGGKAKGTAENPCPKRLAYIKSVVEGWTPPPAATPPAPAAAAPAAATGATAPKGKAPAKKSFHWYDPRTWF